MSKIELKRTIKNELRQLNWRIDMKIMRGLPYREDARRHKLLLMQLDRIAARKSWGGRTGIFNRMTNMASALTSFVL